MAQLCTDVLATGQNAFSAGSGYHLDALMLQASTSAPVPQPAPMVRVPRPAPTARLDNEGTDNEDEPVSHLTVAEESVSRD